MKIYKLIPSMKYYEASNDGCIRRIGSKKDLRPCIKNGYEAVSLWMDGKQYPRYVHRLVAEAFISDCSEFAINHIDGIKTNNHIDNLEIVTYSENQHHAYKTGLRFVTEKQKKALLQNVSKRVLDIETGIFYDSLSNACNVNNVNYSAIRKRIMRKSKNVRFVYV
jgi:hypothetical protein